MHVRPWPERYQDEGLNVGFAEARIEDIYPPRTQSLFAFRGLLESRRNGQRGREIYFQTTQDVTDELFHGRIKVGDHVRLEYRLVTGPTYYKGRATKRVETRPLVYRIELIEPFEFRFERSQAKADQAEE